MKAMLVGILDQYFRSVRPMHMGYVAPQKRHADIIVPNEDRNEVAISIIASGLLAHLQTLRRDRSID